MRILRLLLLLVEGVYAWVALLALLGLHLNSDRRRWRRLRMVQHRFICAQSLGLRRRRGIVLQLPALPLVGRHGHSQLDGEVI